jgi:hypothetical protein
MGVDEEGTLRQIKAHRKELVDPKITEHRSRECPLMTQNGHAEPDRPVVSAFGFFVVPVISISSSELSRTQDRRRWRRRGRR